MSLLYSQSTSYNHHTLHLHRELVIDDSWHKRFFLIYRQFRDVQSLNTKDYEVKKSYLLYTLLASFRLATAV